MLKSVKQQSSHAALLIRIIHVLWEQQRSAGRQEQVTQVGFQTDTLSFISTSSQDVHEEVNISSFKSSQCHITLCMKVW